jgi:hypothetical protein
MNASFLSDLIKYQLFNEVFSTRRYLKELVDHDYNEIYRPAKVIKLSSIKSSSYESGELKQINAAQNK